MKKIVAVTLATALTLSLAACGTKPAESAAPAESSATESKAAAAESVSVKFGNTQNEEDIQTMALREVSDRLSKATDGAFEAKVYTSSSLGETDDLTEQAMQGSAILTVSDPSRLAAFVKDYGILNMPYIFDDYTGLDKMMETDLYSTWEQAFADQGIWLVTSNWYSGARNFCLNKTVNKPEDLAGQRIRTIGNDICTKSVNAMGAVATPMSWSEVYTTIQQKGLDGAEVQTPSFYGTRLWEVVNTLNRTEHFQLIGSVVSGTTFRDSLSDEYKELFSTTFKDVGTEYQSKCVELSKQYEKEMVEKYGMTINEDVDVQAFKDATAPVYDELGYADVLKQLRSEMGA